MPDQQPPLTIRVVNCGSASIVGQHAVLLGQVDATENEPVGLDDCATLRYHDR